MAFIDTHLSAFDATTVLNGSDGQGSVVIPKGQLRHHLPEFITALRIQTKTSRTPITVYFAEAKNEEAMVVGCSGFKHDEILDFDQIKRLNNQGVSFMWVGLPNPHRKPEFVQHFIDAGTDLLLDPQHDKIKEWMARDVPKIFHGHSTGAQLFFHLMRHDETFEKLTNEFSGAALSSTALEYPLKILHAAFHYHAKSHLDELPQETTGGKLYLKLSKMPAPDLADEIKRREYLAKQAYIHPTFAQMLELEKYGALAQKDIYDPTSNVNNRGDFPVMMFSGKNDWVANAKPQERAAKAIDALHIHSKTSYHSPLTQDDESFDIYNQGLGAIANDSFDDLRKKIEASKAPTSIISWRRPPQAAADASPDNAPQAF